MKRFAVLGLGNFGSHLARSLARKGAEVLAVDIDEQAVLNIKDSVTQAVVANASDKKALLSLDIEKFDCVVVSLGEKVDASILIALFLKKVGVKEILVKAISEDHVEALKNVGATIVVFPERDIAEKVADNLITPNLIDFIPVSDGHSIVEIKAPHEFFGRTLADLKLRNRFGVHVLAVRTPEKQEITTRKTGNVEIPDGDFRIQENQVLIIMGENRNIEKIRKLS
ncbi:MAG: TrkA family potassium uptake protein [Candidatus Abyssobacteria bacterium SURF_5]|uniref:TrkA family potassium uptake protein n=1 Tax=Abyssobacteria bacterium (strain SURF_5) TaxID=2093360 RepID=A0A3A4NFW0_ABYX5|nr:MAG: TrkA family potassium uptake protein [Candidatus Abyssubacteria bacterium SURF_5]